jgi:hypothetical protein
MALFNNKQIEYPLSGSFSGSLQGTASFALNALTASYVNSLQQDVIISGSLSNGLGTIISGIYSHAEGNNTVASGFYSHAEGGSTIASGLYSHAEGTSTIASGTNSHAEGNSTRAIGTNSHAEGVNTEASGVTSHAEGASTVASGLASHAEGASTIASGPYSHAEGNNTVASGNVSHAEGNSTIASGSYSHAEGFGTIASGDFQHVQGTYNKSSSFIGAFILGNGTDNSNRSNLIFASGSSVQITGSLNVSGSITGSLLGTASFANNIAPGLNIIASDLLVNNALLLNQTSASLTTGTKTLSSIATGSYTSAFYNYTVASGSNARSGQVIIVWTGNLIQYADSNTVNIGNTTSVVFTASLSGANINLTTVLPSNSWTVKTLITLL